jgi:predicted Zn-ribbon and HTH transcriptional regulator
VATVVECRKCRMCGTKYRTKIKKGQDTRTCPVCQGKGVEKSIPAPVGGS